MTVAEIIARPVDAVQRLFIQAGCPTTEGDWGVPAHFEEAIASLGSGQVPLLQADNADRLPHHSLVRFYGMVQDLLNPEYYVGAVKQGSDQLVTTKFCDLDLPADASHDEEPILWERRPVLFVPIPGVSSWTVPAEAAAAASASALAAAAVSAAAVAQQDKPGEQQMASEQPAQSVRAKRERSAEMDAPHDHSPQQIRMPGAQLPQQIEEEQEDEARQDTDMAADQGANHSLVQDAVTGADDDEGSRRRIRRREDSAAAAAAAGAAPSAAASEPAAASNTASDAHRHCDVCSGGPSCTHGPVGEVQAAAEEGPQEVKGSCMVYLYGSAPSLVLHEVVEVVGVLSHVPQLAALEGDSFLGPHPHLEHELASLGLRDGAVAPAEGGAAAAAGGQAGAEGAGAGGGAAAGQGRGQAVEDLALEALRAAHPPTSKVMRLHAILVRRAPQLVPPAQQQAPAAAPAAPAADAPATTSSAPGAAAAAAPVAPAAVLRERALGVLRHALGGDALAAEYVLLQLLARVTHRGGDPGALGHMVLNLCRCPNAPAAESASTPAACPAACSLPLQAERLGSAPSPFARALHAAVGSLVPLSAVLPLTVEACNRVAWCPKRDFSRERTSASPLQLAPGTALLLDETVMAPGQLDAQGVASMQALMTLAQRQELMYDFDSYQHPIPVDLPTLVLTQGRSLLRDSISLRVPLNATRPIPSREEVLAAAAAAAGEAAAAAPGGAEDPMAPVRSYLAAARATQAYDIADGMAAQLEQYFVSERRGQGAAAAAGGANAAAAGAAAGGAERMSPEEFHVKLALARLLVLSHGESVLTAERWQQLLQLEHTREARLRVM